MIRLAALFPDQLNLNGDQGNLEVLTKQLKWRGVPSEVFAVRTVAELEQRFDLIFVGHGSIAAWSSIDDEFHAMTPKLAQLIRAGVPGMSISTGFEKLVESGVLTVPKIEPLKERISKFEIFEDSHSEVLGYLNTDVNLPVLHREQNWIASMLHGPVLAKNPALLNEALGNIASHADVEIPELKEKAGQLADLIKDVWELERELASE
jgi:lipid II isoglutaminyl synthase (glutamine-hydrolysing)